MGEMDLRQMTADDASEVAELIYASINVWYRDNGHSEIQFQGGPGVTEVFYETYNALAPARTWSPSAPRAGGSWARASSTRARRTSGSGS